MLLYSCHVVIFLKMTYISFDQKSKQIEMVQMMIEIQLILMIVLILEFSLDISRCK